jgi:heterodisulfide reductase subunit E
LERLTLFWLFHLILLTLFSIEMIFVLSIWLRGRVPGLPSTASPWQKIRSGVSFALGLVFSRRILKLVQTVARDSLVQKRILDVSPRRWFAHFAVFGSFAILAVLSTVTGLAVEIFPRIFPPTHFLNTNVIFVTLRDVDHPVVAVLNDFLGVLIIVGLAMMVYRRYVQKPAQLRTGGSDTTIFILLGGIALTGFPLEAFRLLAHQPFAPTAGWAFTGYPLAWIMQGLPFNWTVWYNGAFWVHFAIANMLLFYAPFSRFAHVLMSPLIVALNVMEESTP